MTKKKGKGSEAFKLAKIKGLNMNRRDLEMFLHRPRDFGCFSAKERDNLAIHKVSLCEVMSKLASRCYTIEHQIIALRDIVKLSSSDFKRRLAFSQALLRCIYRHHNVVYQGFMFGSSVNGLGFRDSDVDLRLRPIRHIGNNNFEPVPIDDDVVERVLRNIAQQTTRCSPSLGEYVPSSRCPVAKLLFFSDRIPSRLRKLDPNHLQEGLKFDVTLSTSSHLGTFNSMFLRFLCNLEPRFHLLATVVRFWSTANGLIVPGYLSSYALVNMVIYFCQVIQPPLLPTVNKMRSLYLKHDLNYKCNRKAANGKKAITQLEWQCLISLDRNLYKKSTNSEPVCVLLLKFFEFYLNFPYSSQIITIRPGRTLTHEEFKTSAQFHPKFPIKEYLNIQDPFDLKHNLTSGMSCGHFKQFIMTIRISYERLFNQLMNQFHRPNIDATDLAKETRSKILLNVNDPCVWGLMPLFLRPTEQELHIKEIASEK